MLEQFYTLRYYTEQVKGRSTEALRYAISEIHEILPRFEAQPHCAQYVNKLYNELDACRTELQSRHNPAKRRSRKAL